MTEAQKKAEELLLLFYNSAYTTRPVYASELARIHALICVDEILKECKFLGTADYRIPFWQEVKSSLESKD